jgi:transcriptional regulator with XRE-family HTH domain
MLRPEQWLATTQRRQITSQLAEKADRDAFVRQCIESSLAFQIHAMRRSCGLSQAGLAGELGKPQSVISRLENGRYGHHSLNTLFEIASRFDVALIVAFAPFSELVDRTIGSAGRAVDVPPHPLDHELQCPYVGAHRPADCAFSASCARCVM